MRLPPLFSLHKSDPYNHYIHSVHPLLFKLITVPFPYLGIWSVLCPLSIYYMFGKIHNHLQCCKYFSIPRAGYRKTWEHARLLGCFLTNFLKVSVKMSNGHSELITQIYDITHSQLLEGESGVCTYDSKSFTSRNNGLDFERGNHALYRCPTRRGCEMKISKCAFKHTSRIISIEVFKHKFALKNIMTIA